MSGISAVNSANVSFQGKKTENKEGSKLKKVASKLAQPVKDAYVKKYQEYTNDGEVKATPKLVADFVGDNLFKGLMAVGGAAVVFIKSRRMTNGFTKAFKGNLSEAVNATKDVAAKKGTSAFETVKNVVVKTVNEVQENNIKSREVAKAAVEKATEQALTEGKSASKFLKNLKNIILKPAKKFDDTSKLSEAIDKHFNPKHAAKLKDTFKSVGVKNGDDLVDLAASAAITGAVTGGLVEITDETTAKDDKSLAQSELQGKVAEEAEEQTPAENADAAEDTEAKDTEAPAKADKSAKKPALAPKNGKDKYHSTLRVKREELKALANLIDELGRAAA